jgi:uncharacterized repeat protein (TIGR03837 family)
MRRMQWDLFCRVIDNHGDLGVCWRLAADLASHGERVRLWIDDPSALSWMAPDGAVGVSAMPWPVADAAVEPGDAVVEAFGCELPEWFVARMAAKLHSPAWINLEYLSAESFVERSHRLRSPQLHGASEGMRKSFFYPGFTQRTGGLIREPGLLLRMRLFDAGEWLLSLGISRGVDERVVSLFCYEQSALPSLIDRLSERPTLLLVTAGHASRQTGVLLGESMHRGRLRAVLLPALSQVDFDHLLWASDLNFVRGEDSFVRAQWAGKPFVWQIYPQHDGAHLIKLEAFIDRFGQRLSDDAASASVAAFFRAWNSNSTSLPPWPELEGWRQQCTVWRESLTAQIDLTTQLIRHAIETR